MTLNVPVYVNDYFLEVGIYEEKAEKKYKDFNKELIDFDKIKTKNSFLGFGKKVINLSH